MKTFDLLKSLCDNVCIGHINTLPLPAEAKKIGNSYSLFIEGESEYTVCVEAHIDEIGFIVTAVDERGFLRVATVGGIDLRTLPSHRVLVHGRETVPGVFTSIPPHLTKGEPEFDDIKKLSIDTFLGEKARDVISVGDYVSFYSPLTSLAGSRVCGKSLDDRAGVCVLLSLFERFKEKKPPVSLKLLFCSEEELGMRGAKTAAFSEDCDEAIALDVSFATAPSVSPEEAGKLGGGAMIGISPILNSKIYKKLISLAKSENIPYQSEVMGGRTGTDADAISISRSGVPTALVSIPQRNMHTFAEVVDLKDIEATVELLYTYIMGGGAK